MLDLGIQQSLQQRQVMSQKMIQAVQILGMNIYQLEHFIQEQMRDNPVIEIKDSFAPTSFSINNDLQYLNNREIEDFHTLQDDLLFQWHTELPRFKRELKDDKIDFSLIEKVGEWIIYHINDQGFLIISEEEIAKKFEINIELSEQVLQLIQSLEPVGVGSRTVEEYLTIQLKSNKIEDVLLLKLINEHLNLVAKKKWKELCNKLSIRMNQLKKYMEIIYSLSPGLQINHQQESQYIQPEVKVVQLHDTYDVVWINDKEVSLYIASYYHKCLKDKDIDAHVKKYISGNIKKAMWLIRNIQERRNNIINISKYIVQEQEIFMKFGKKYLKPMTQQMVAEALEISISTVSRIVNGKYIETPVGVYELKYFFSGSLQTKNSDISTMVIKEKIKKLIHDEDKRKPLSDEKVKDFLNVQGVKISRRTVAKYREQLGIPNASHRKEI